MKKNLKKAVLLTLAVVGMGTFNSCKDNDAVEDQRLQIEALKKQNATLAETLEAQVAALKDQLAAIKSCQCGPGLTEARVIEMINEAIQTNQSSDAFKALIKQIIDEGGFQNAAQVQAAIKAYMDANPAEGGLTQEEVNELINAAVANQPSAAQVQEMIAAAVAGKVDADDFKNKVETIIIAGGFQTTEQVSQAIKDYMEAHPASGLTAEQVQEMINLAIETLATKAQLAEVQTNMQLAIAAAEAKMAQLASKEELAELVNLLNDRHDIAQAMFDEMNTKQVEMATKIAELDEVATQAAAALGEIMEQVTELATAVGELAEGVEAIAEAGSELKDACEAFMAQTAADKATLVSAIEGLNNAVAAINEEIQDLIARATALEAQATANAEKIAALEAALADIASCDCDNEALKSKLDSMANEMAQFATKQELEDAVIESKAALRDVLSIAEMLAVQLKNEVARVEDFAVEKIADLQAQLDALVDPAVLQAYMDKVDALEAQVEENTKAIEALNNALAKLITNVTIQGVHNPAFGSFAFPFGVQSNILMGYYGENENDLYFPTRATANYIYKETALTAADAAMLGDAVESFYMPAQSTLVEETEGNAGKIYLTINPTNVDFTGTKFTLVNSQDEESAVKLGEAVKSNTTLRFGYTRADNGFYEIPATFTADNIPVFEQHYVENLKAIGKNVLKAPSNLDLSGIAREALDMVQQMNSLEALGVKAAWDDENYGSNSVYSKYEVAAAAVKPLSYAFLYDVNVGDKIVDKMPTLPTINPITDAFLNELIDFDALHVDVNFDLSDISFNIGSTAVTIPPINISFPTVQLSTLGNIVASVNIPQYEVQGNAVDGYTLVQTGTTSQSVSVSADAFAQSIADAINDALQSAGETVGAEMQAQLQSALEDNISGIMGDVESAVNDLIQNQLQDKINGQLQTSVQDIFDQVKDQVNNGVGNAASKFNGYINKFNGVVNKYNQFLDKFADKLNGLNSKLQVAMMYQTGDGRYHHLSTSKGMPTIFNGAGAANLFATSYNFDMLVPSYKKFVAVTNVFNGEASAQGGDATCKSVLDNVNAGEYFNTVIPGSRFGVAAENLVPGYTYEIFYSSVDYAGKISARKFYIKVK